MYMFYSRLMNMMCIKEQISDCASKQLNSIDSVNHIISQLSGMTGMDEVIPYIQAKRNDLEEEQRKLVNLAQGLERVCYRYSARETENCDEAQGVHIYYTRTKIKRVKVDTIPDSLKKYM